MKEKPTIEKITFKDTKFTWISINNPNEKSVEYLRKKFKFHHLDLEDVLSETQRPKIDEYDEYLFLVLHAPVKPQKNRMLSDSEVDIFIGQNYVITIHQDDPTIKEVFEKCKKKPKKKEEYMSKGSGYLLYMIVDDIFESKFPLMDNISKNINALEKEVFDPDYSRDDLKEILMLKKDIINFRRIIMPQRSIIANLEHKNKKFLPEKLDVYFDDIVDKIEKLWNNLENMQELVASLQDTNESIISHNTNNVIKILTLFSVVMLPLTFITGFYGMNVQGLPLAQHSLSISFIAGILVLIAISMIGYFKYKNWL